MAIKKAAPKPRVKVQTTEQIFTRLIEQTNWRAKQDIGTWRSATITAENRDWPNRTALYSLYDEIILDAHVQGLLTQRITKLLGHEFKLANKQGEADAEGTALFNAPWFYKVLEYALESRWWGHSLIQLWDAQPNGFGSVQLIPRRHVVPEYGGVSIMQGNLVKAEMINYREEPDSDWLIEVCADTRSLGLFHAAAPAFIFKKNALLQWSQYTEVFGMPVRIGKTASRQQKDMQRMADNLKRMGTAAYAVFQEGESIEFIESTKGDAFEVYDKLIERANSELSKLLLGQTMTSDNGSSRSQAEVHERVADNIADSDKRFISFMINEQLIPRMIKHGYKLDGLRFQWEVSKDLDALWSKTKDALNYYEVPPEWIQKTFGIPVEAKEKPSKGVVDEDEEPVKQPSKKANGSLMATLKAHYTCNCPDCATDVTLSEGNNDVSISAADLIKFTYDNRENPDLLHANTQLETSQTLLRGFQGAYTTGFEEQGARGVIAKIQQNIIPFSAAKTFTQMEAMRGKLYDDKGLRSFDAFKREVEGMGKQFNETWLRTEYNYAVACGQMADRWQQYVDAAHLYPNLTYVTVMDERVREEHQILHGITLPITDPFWKKYYPPNGYNCRCDVAQDDSEKTTDPKTAGALAKDKAKVSPLFQNNVGQNKVVFKDSHPYFETSDGKVKNLNYKSYGLKPMDEAKRSNKAAAANLESKQAFEQWKRNLKDGKKYADVMCCDGIKAIVDNAAFDHVKAKTDKQHWEVSNNLTDLLLNPSESWMYKSRDKYTRSFIKHYMNKTIIAVANLEEGRGWVMQTWFEWDGVNDLEVLRQGMLMWLTK